MAHNYVLRVTAGPSYDEKTHQIVPVNTAKPVKISSEHIEASVNVRIESYRGLPRSSPATSAYFSAPPHASAHDQYSISFAFRLLPPPPPPSPRGAPTAPRGDAASSAVPGAALVFGNDFEHPIRDRLPPGFGTALKIVKWAIDPGLDGDVYAEKPYLYGGLGGSLNRLWVGDREDADGEGDRGDGKGAAGGAAGRKEEEEEEGEREEGHDAGKAGAAGRVFEEGGSEAGLRARREKGVPDGEAQRKKWFLNETNRKEWVWEAGREYGCDFFNPYLDFNEFALKLPGFTMPIMKYWDGQPLRYTLKNTATNTELLVVQFTLHLKEDVDESGNIIDRGYEPGKTAPATEDARTQGKAVENTEKREERKATVETNENDVD